MSVKVRHLWENISSGFWFVPSVMTGAAGIAALVMVHVDGTYLTSDSRVGWLYSGGSEGAKTLLSTVAGSAITVASVVFSITIAALTQASSQFGPRLLRNFMRDKSNQIVLGTFNATFLYCLLVLRTVHGKVEDGSSFVPQASVTGAVLLAIASIAVLIYFIHHVSILLEAPSIIAAVRADFSKAMDVMEGDQKGVLARGGNCSAEEGRLGGDQASAATVASRADGYVQAVDYATLEQLGDRFDLVLRLRCRAGDYLMAGGPLLDAAPAERCPAKLRYLVNEAFIIGGHRTAEQDIEYAIRQIAEVAVRALSPGINDPFTAINCIDALGSVICRVARSGLPAPCRSNAAGVVRLIVPVSTFDGVTDMALNQIRQYGRDSVAVTIRLLEVIGRCADGIKEPGYRKTLLRHAEMVYRQSQNPEAIPEALDRGDVKKRWDIVAAALGGDPDTR